jgi:hypothetical protein
LCIIYDEVYRMHLIQTAYFLSEPKAGLRMVYVSDFELDICALRLRPANRANSQNEATAASVG